MMTYLSFRENNDELKALSNVKKSDRPLLTRNKGLLSIDEDSLLSSGSLIDDFETIISVGLEDSLIPQYEKELQDLEKGLKWEELENRPIAELVLLRERKKAV